MHTRDLTRQAIIAAAYAAITIGLEPISYGAVQFRLAEMLVVLPFLNKKHTIGLTIGCFLANMASPLGIYDMVCGVLATFVVCVAVSRLRSMKFIAPISASVNGVVVGLMLHVVLGVPLLAAMVSVAIGQFVTVSMGVAAVALMRSRLAFLEE